MRCSETLLNPSFVVSRELQRVLLSSPGGRASASRKVYFAMILTDNETRVDLLNNEAIANDHHRVAASATATPCHHRCPWRLGRRQIQRPRDDRGWLWRRTTDVLCLKFNGWRFQGFEDAKIALDRRHRDRPAREAPAC